MKERILYAIVLIILAYFLFSKDKVEPIIITETITNTDTITTIDTITTTKIKYVVKEVVRMDTVRVNDSVYIPIPISSYLFKDDRYEAVVSGFNVSLDKMTVFPKTTTIYTEKLREITLPPKRITHGLNIGAGMVYTKYGWNFGGYLGYGFKIRIGQ